jgi:hypothetical protein
VYDIPPNTGKLCVPYEIVLIQGPGVGGATQVKLIEKLLLVLYPWTSI